MISWKTLDLSIERNGESLLEADLGVLGNVTLVAARVVGQRVDVAGRLHPGVLEHAALNGSAPKVVVDRVRARLGRGHGNPTFLGVGHLLIAGLELPLAHRREHFEVRVERSDAHLETDLVVALPGASVRDVLGLVAVRLDHKMLHDDRPRHRREERILVLVERIGPQRLGQELLDVLLTDVLDDGLDRADRERLLPDELEILSLLSDVHG